MKRLASCAVLFFLIGITFSPFVSACSPLKGTKFVSYIHIFNFDNLEERTIQLDSAGTTDDCSSLHKVDIDSEYVLWTDNWNEIKLLNRSTDRIERISISDYFIGYPQVYNGKIYYVEADSIYEYNITTKYKFRITNLKPFQVLQFSQYGDNISYITFDPGSNNYELFVHNLQNNNITIRINNIISYFDKLNTTASYGIIISDMDDDELLLHVEYPEKKTLLFNFIDNTTRVISKDVVSRTPAMDEDKIVSQSKGNLTIYYKETGNITTISASLRYDDIAVYGNLIVYLISTTQKTSNLDGVLPSLNLYLILIIILISAITKPLKRVNRLSN